MTLASRGDSCGFGCGGGGWFAGVHAGGARALTDSCETGAAIAGVGAVGVGDTRENELMGP